MNSDRKNMLKDAAILFVITLFAGLILGTVYQVTKEPIAAQKAKAEQEACMQVFAEAAAFEIVETTVFTDEQWKEQGFEGVAVGKVMKAEDASGSILGYVMTVTDHNGYGGDIQFMMGIKTDGTLNGISLLAIAETAGLGMRAEEVLVPQYAGKNVESFEYVKGGAQGDTQIDAISGATITTDAITTGVNAGLYYFRTELAEGGMSNE